VVLWRCVDNTWPVAALTAHSEASYWLRIAISAYPTCIRRPTCIQHPHWGGGVPLEYCHAVWYGKTRMLGYPTVKKILKIFLFVLTECTHVMDGETDGHRMTAKPALA